MSLRRVFPFPAPDTDTDPLEACVCVWPQGGQPRSGCGSPWRLCECQDVCDHAFLSAVVSTGSESSSEHWLMLRRAGLYTVCLSSGLGSPSHTDTRGLEAHKALSWFSCFFKRRLLESSRGCAPGVTQRCPHRRQGLTSVAGKSPR